jgi:hypothetical protein
MAFFRSFLPVTRPNPPFYPANRLMSPFPEPKRRNLRKRYHDGTTLQLVMG